ncbi:MAG: aminoacetone oxidase family FAD-binding enzyme [Lachnospiraceae bacterium]|nr:aminoacetone oxidase family FAD-binding enzyme [Lachnospiraceae bacterium]
MKNGYDCIVAGAGPAGLMAAITAAREGAKVLLLERKSEPCKKLYATGNGRCNFTNLNMDEGVYRGGGAGLAREAVDTFDRNDLLGFFHDLGLMTKHIGDYVYPYNEQASSVAGVLLSEIRRLGVELHCDEMVVDIIPSCDEMKVDINYIVKTDKEEYRATNVIITVGGKASPTHGSDGSLNKVIRRLGHRIIPQQPALVPLLFSDKTLSELAGVRVKCGAFLQREEDALPEENVLSEEEVLSEDGKQDLLSEEGEIIFNKDNISGIPVMQLSRFAVMEIEEGRSCCLLLDFFPRESREELQDWLKRSATTWADPLRTVSDVLSFCLPEKLADHILKKCGLSPEDKAAGLSEKTIGRITELCKGFPVPVCDNAGFNRAQVTAGGVDCDQVSDRMESLLHPGLFFAGEVLDVDGTCGGYNLHWAFASGRIAGREAAARCGKRD